MQVGGHFSLFIMTKIQFQKPHQYINENFVVATCKKGMQESNDTAMLSGVRMFISQSAGFTRLIVCRLNASTTLVGFFFIYK